MLQITRPVNALLAGIVVLVGFTLGGRGREADLAVIIFGPLAALLIAAFANLDNDLCDIAIDRINRPDRPLPAGRLSVKSVIFLSRILLLLGLFAALWCGFAPLAVSGAIALLLVTYNRWAKRRFLIGNVMVALAGGMTFVFAGLAVSPLPGRWKYLWLAGGLAFAFHLAREVLKDIQDIEGDRQAGAATLPIVWGTKPTARAAGGYLVFIAFLSITPYIYGWFNQIYLYGIIVMVLIPSGYICRRLWSNSTSKEIGRWSTGIKMMMAIGLTLLWLGAGQVQP